MDRRRMRELAFRDAGALKRLEACLHPLIGAAVTREFESLSASPIVIYDCPLLWRDDFRHPAVSRVLVIDASDDVRLSRIVSRPGLTEETARLMMKAQPPRSRILQCADDLIVNEDDEARSASALTHSAASGWQLPDERGPQSEGLWYF